MSLDQIQDPLNEFSSFEEYFVQFSSHFKKKNLQYKATSSKLMPENETSISHSKLLELQKFQGYSLQENIFPPTVQSILKQYKSKFSKWRIQLDLGFNLLFFGYGSKKKLLQDFVEPLAERFPVVVVNGYFPGVTLKDV